jgi:hypothetical protein
MLNAIIAHAECYMKPFMLSVIMLNVTFYLLLG